MATPQRTPVAAFFTSFRNYTQATVARGGAETLKRLSLVGASDAATFGAASDEGVVELDSDEAM